MASTAIPQSSQEALQHFLPATSPPPPHSSEAGAQSERRSESSEDRSRQAPMQMVADPSSSPPSGGERNSSEVPHNDPYQYTETSGSNSGEEDDRELGGGSHKRLGGHLNGFSSKKRRKQSKPIRLGSGGEQEEQPSQSGQDASGAPEGPEEGEINSTTPELEDGERRPGMLPDLPLNLSAAAAAAMQSPGSLRVLGAELLQNPDKLPASAASIYQNMLAGMPPFPFPFPPTSKSGGGNSSAPPISASGRPQIFNPEAYCELCNKEFCNKYFLKTHKANKHGIYSEGMPPTSGSPPTSTSSTPGMPPGSGSAPGEKERGQITPSDSAGAAGPPTPNSQAGSPFSGAFIAANMGALRPPFMPLSPGASPSPKSGDPNGQQHQQQKDAPNSKEEQRGEQQPPSSDSPGIRTPSIPPIGMLSPRGEPPSIPDFRQNIEERERLMQRELANGGAKENGELRKSLESPGQRTTPITSTPSGLPILPPHLNFNPLMFGGLPSLDALRKDAEMEGSPLNRPIPNIPNIPNVSSSSGGKPKSPLKSGGPIPKGPFTPDKLRQMGVINADAFCEICCKEFCNKYFLRVHKLKKHGICSPDLPPEKVQKILNQMAKEAGKTGNPPPPIVRPPALNAPPGLGGLSPDKSPALPLGPAGFPLRPPGLMSLPPLEPLQPQALKDFMPKTSLAPPSMGGAGGGDNGFMGRPPPPLTQHSPAGSTNNKGEQEVIRINDDSEDGQPRGEEREGGAAAGGERSSSVNENSEANGSGSEEGMQPPSEDLQRLQTMIMELNNSKMKSTLMPPSNGGSESPAPGQEGANETVCKVCKKDMENKYFLRAHMMNEHGMLHTEEPPQLPIGMPADLAKRLPEQERREGGKEKEFPGLPQFPPNPLGLPNPQDILNGLDMPPGAAQDFAAKFLQQMQKGLGGLPLPPLDGDERSFLEKVKNELAAAGAGGPLGSPLNKNPLDKDPNRKPASLSRSYCDICKKELCNKYFMKTHMLKMHGINIEAAGSVGVSCHICKKELCSKYFLKVHMQNSHGLMEDGSPIPPHLKENGSALFGGVFPPMPPPELLGMSAGPPGSGNGGPPPSSLADKEHYFSRLLGEQSELSRERIEKQKQLMEEGGAKDGATPSVEGPAHTCSLCGEGFPEIVALQVHIIKSHGAFPPEANPFSNLGGGDAAGRKSPPSTPSEGNMPHPQSNNSSQQQQQQGINNDNAEANKRPPTAPAGTGLSDERSEGEVTPTKPPSTPSATPSSNAADGNKGGFPNIEMLQRHMLSQQFPGLINPLLGGFPGFPGGPGGLPFPNPLQQLLAGSNGSLPPGLGGGVAEGQQKTPDTPTSASSTSNAKGGKKKAASTVGGRRRRFKCSKCQLKFKRRDSCLRHIHSSHSAFRRRLQFTSPLKSASKSKVRTHYVKRLMEVLKVPTSRATPAADADGNLNTKHIMQAFLLQKEKEEEAEAEKAASDFVPSVVFLPVSKRVSQPMTVAFSLTPA